MMARIVLTIGSYNSPYVTQDLQRYPTLPIHQPHEHTPGSTFDLVSLPYCVTDTLSNFGNLTDEQPRTD